MVPAAVLIPGSTPGPRGCQPSLSLTKLPQRPGGSWRAERSSGTSSPHPSLHPTSFPIPSRTPRCQARGTQVPHNPHPKPKRGYNGTKTRFYSPSLTEEHGEQSWVTRGDVSCPPCPWGPSGVLLQGPGGVGVPEHPWPYGMTRGMKQAGEKCHVLGVQAPF